MTRVQPNVGEHILRDCLVVGHALGEPADVKGEVVTD